MKEECLKIYNEGEDENVSFCVENIHGEFIVYKRLGDENYILGEFNQLPEEFKDYLLVAKDECEKPELRFLGRYTIDFGHLLSSTFELENIRKNVVYELGKLHAFLNNGWELESSGVATLTFRTQLKYVPHDETEE
ncbi:hypothetical protein ACFL7D_05645 [candidate division KSB1 bacterium]